MRSKSAGWLVPAVLVFVAVLGCDADNLLGPGAPQGIEGTVQIGPQCPVQSATNPCPDLPYQAWIAIHTPDGKTVTRVQSGSDGRFRVGLQPGRYVLDPESGNPFPIAGQVQVDVDPGSYATVVINFDTGIR